VPRRGFSRYWVWSVSSGSYNELSFNPTGPVWESTGKLNPFAVARVREAMNYLIDRNFIVQEIYGGLGCCSLARAEHCFRRLRRSG
jgi:hypothetical protein